MKKNFQEKFMTSFSVNFIRPFVHLQHLSVPIDGNLKYVQQNINLAKLK